MVAESAADAERWAQARSLLEGGADAAAQKRAQQRTRQRMVIVVAAILLGSGATGFLLQGLVDPNFLPVGSPAEGTAQGIVRTVIMFAGLALFALGATQGWRRLRRLGGLRGPAVVLTRAQQKQLLAQVRGKRDVDPAHLPLARNLAERSLSQLRPLVVMSAGVGVICLAQWISSPPAFYLVVNTFAAVMFGIACVLGLREARRARAFLAAHPAGG